MYCQGIEQVREQYLSRKKKDKAFSFVKRLRKKILEQFTVKQD